MLSLRAVHSEAILLSISQKKSPTHGPSSSIESFDGPRVATGCLDTHGVPALARHPHHSAARSRRATPATPHTSVWKHMPTTVLRGAPSQATSSVYRSSGHPAHELLLMWARWLCGSGSALMWAHPHTAPNPLTACIASQACMIHRLALSHQCRPLSVVQTQPLLLFTQRWCRALISVPTWESQP